MSLTAGLAVVDEKYHSETDHPDTAKEMQTANLYAIEIARLAQKGAQVVVLPEKIVTTTPITEAAIKNVFVNAATANHVAIVAGYTDLMNDHTKLNKALVISDKGELVSDYQKVNLFEGEARGGFIPGNEISVFAYPYNQPLYIVYPMICQVDTVTYDVTITRQIIGLNTIFSWPMIWAEPGTGTVSPCGDAITLNMTLSAVYNSPPGGGYSGTGVLELRK